MTVWPRNILLFLMIGIALGSIALSLCKGSMSVPIYQLLFSRNSEINTIFFQLRLPRTVTAFTCGGLLALSGSIMQLLLRNPLADPYVLGISGGAALFTLIVMLCGANEYWLFGSAWLGSLFTILVILALAKQHRFQTHALLLSGMALACGFSAGISFILFMSPAANLHSMIFWLAGDLNGTVSPWLGLSLLCVGFIVCLCLAPGMNLLGRGEKEAQALGLASDQYRFMLYLISSLLTAAAVTLTGCIGFIGLIIPHLARRLSGYDHRRMLPVAVLLGGSLLTMADTCARTLFAPQQIPVGILMALLGVPIFIWILQR